MVDTETLGYIGTFLINVAYLPQVIKTIRTNNTQGLSVLMYLILVLSGITWIAFAIKANSNSLLLCNSINLIQAVIILGLILKSKYKAKTS